MTDSPIYQDLHPWVDNVNYWFRNLGQGDKECMVVQSTRQIQNKIDLREVLCARETGQLPTNLIMFSLNRWTQNLPWVGVVINCHNQNTHAPIVEVISLGPHPPPLPTPPPLPGIFNFHKELKIHPPSPTSLDKSPLTPSLHREGLSQ